MAKIGAVQAAERLGISRRRVLALIAAGRLKAEKIAGAWIIDERSLAAVKHRPQGWPKGRPRPRKGDQKK